MLASHLRCTGCGAASETHAVYCSQCGAHLPRPLEDSEAARLHGERRQLTALFCDLVGSTRLAASLDPEEYHDLIRVFAQCVRDVVGHYGGYVAEFRGDGALAFFG